MIIRPILFVFIFVAFQPCQVALSIFVECSFNYPAAHTRKLTQKTSDFKSSTTLIGPISYHSTARAFSLSPKRMPQNLRQQRNKFYIPKKLPVITGRMVGSENADEVRKIDRENGSKVISIVRVESSSRLKTDNEKNSSLMGKFSLARNNATTIPIDCRNCDNLKNYENFDDNSGKINGLGFTQPHKVSSQQEVTLRTNNTEFATTNIGEHFFTFFDSRKIIESSPAYSNDEFQGNIENLPDRNTKRFIASKTNSKYSSLEKSELIKNTDTSAGMRNNSSSEKIHETTEKEYYGKLATILGKPSTGEGEFIKNSYSPEKNYDEPSTAISTRYDEPEKAHEEPKEKWSEPSTDFIEPNSHSATYSESSKIYSEPEKVYSEPSKFYSEPAKVYSEPEKIYGEPSKVYSEPAKVYSEPEKIYGEPSKVYSEPAKVYSEPEKTYGEPSKFYSEPAKVYSEPEKIYSEPSKDYSEPAKVYSEPEKIYSEPSKDYSEPAKVYSEPEKIYSKPSKYYSEPAKVYSEPEKIYGEPSKVYSEPAKVFSEPEKIYGELGKVHVEPEINYKDSKKVYVPENENVFDDLKKFGKLRPILSEVQNMPKNVLANVNSIQGQTEKMHSSGHGQKNLFNHSTPSKEGLKTTEISYEVQEDHQEKSEIDPEMPEKDYDVSDNNEQTEKIYEETEVVYEPERVHAKINKPLISIRPNLSNLLNQSDFDREKASDINFTQSNLNQVNAHDRNLSRPSSYQDNVILSNINLTQLNTFNVLLRNFTQLISYHDNVSDINPYQEKSMDKNFSRPNLHQDNISHTVSHQENEGSSDPNRDKLSNKNYPQLNFYDDSLSHLELTKNNISNHSTGLNSNQDNNTDSYPGTILDNNSTQPISYQDKVSDRNPYLHHTVNENSTYLNSYQDIISNTNSYQDDISDANQYHDNVENENSTQPNSYQDNLTDRNSYQNRLPYTNPSDGTRVDKNSTLPNLQQDNTVLDTNSNQDNIPDTNSYQDNIPDTNTYQDNIPDTNSNKDNTSDTNSNQYNTSDTNSYQDTIPDTNSYDEMTESQDSWDPTKTTPIEEDTSTHPTDKSSYVVDSENYRKYRVEEKTAEGFIVGEYGVVSHHDGSLRGVRYTAASNINPAIIYETLVKFLSLQ